ncbi:tyrosine-protein phosphatase [Krasilnikoviella flava]|uniref:Protein tyrosine/serine phosphatase n=1 Tax=Krasilnikoviella flava TaxID=526729 RepID=A0A1T5LR46_9MICO|nr:tyrosine-protein phosphatase [Krasilnikoviella flava]SKC78382.1 Protein tyrosine/serine phosphatase [Krasilnikoviella flava]
MTSPTAGVPTSTLDPADPRAVRWGGLPNARDLGGLPTADGGRTRAGRFYRTSRLDHAGPDGLAAMAAAGVGTVVDLRNAAEIEPLELPTSVARHHRPVEDPDDEEFMRVWGPHLDTPRYYATVLERWPALVTDVFHTFAAAPEGAVVYHCAGGRDRTGMVTALLLTLVEVPRAVIVADYLLAVRANNDRAATEPGWDEAYREPEALAAWCDDVAAALDDFLDGVDPAGYLRAHGVADTELDRVRHRLLDPE